MREIVLDTETTGLSHANGDRIIEIACVELVNHIPTGRSFQRYLNPERLVSADAFAIHGLSDAFLADKPRFAEIVAELEEFIQDSPLVIHNAEFDMGFINAELARLERRPLDPTRAVDTVQIARRKFPGAPASLDALCKRFGVDNSARTKHGALLDVELLAEVYLELVGGRQAGLALLAEPAPVTTIAGPQGDVAIRATAARPPRHFAPTAEELAAHAELLKKLADPIWMK
ncbi:MAG TPA: DNA polymerase III subunit epsilon [Hypericibacter adhaerens]|jgi:DNA polymerase-3 subunit epsilon|uniref:DNA polymerase III subunit epsilon n=1 Tax=Hypericibacter adhaerens TaxID=2602016 RepID=UPI002B702D4E|nr:DNA polymerase III subunit epsilon [Hypericibacter adhaerens]HWA41986.1 DNA polymerase III subunit epsilon [Hypericibacter adhaerens]